ncbi:MAG TPA: fumarylacetoacetate hydrolase family protein [Candidatus Akkermansia intestinigallinarum]|uniref:Fumarylacetoacetate hydrolase family protein n=1 Tax=Candidatus Akkermansia intestinigallinarum TaxID=2838431 RepID=A0A9D2AID8_9BACT|nr:fumarylacetoacetate hydrolase family protein [Candidatus Akkermansia intestinigallinarum]
MKLQYYTDEDGETVIGLWVPKRRCFIDVSSNEDQIWAALQPDGKKLRKEIETWISKGAPDGVPVDSEGLVVSSALPVQPINIACLGKSYADHAMEFSGDKPEEPSLFLKSPSAVSADLSCVINPAGAEKLDYEVELAVVIGDTLHRADEKEARRAIIGYTLMCDYSERSYQLEHGGQWTKGKSCDSFAPFGPVLVTRDEIPDPDALQLQLKVNGELRQNGNSSQLIRPVAQLVAYVSQFITLNPGDVVSTGTPGGVGMGMNPPRYLKPGDVVEFGCDAIGWVRQTVIAEDED